MAVVYSIFSAIWGTLSVVFAKLLAQLVEFWVRDENIFLHWFTYVTLVAWLVLMMYWLYRLNSALGLYNPLFIIPLLQSNFIFFAIVSGGIYFQEFNYMGSVEWVGFVAGIISMFSGIALLVPPKEPKTETEGFEDSKGSPMKNLTKKCMTGAGRMNQQAFDIKTRKEKYELLLQDFTAKEMLNLNECKLTDLLRNYIDGADKTLTRESELRDILDAKVIKKDDCSRVKALMRQVNSFQRKLGEADVEINRQSDRVLQNRVSSSPRHRKV